MGEGSGKTAQIDVNTIHSTIGEEKLAKTKTRGLRKEVKARAIERRRDG